jgi:hypothetical protein
MFVSILTPIPVSHNIRHTKKLRSQFTTDDNREGTTSIIYIFP